MNLEVEIRVATLDDAEAIAAVKYAVWPSDKTDINQIRSALQDDEHLALVAIRSDELVGYQDCFITLAADGTRRWELDQLAVHPDYQRQRIGYALVVAATKCGRDYQAGLARGLIQVGNIASQRTFSRAAFRTDGTVYSLYISTNALEHSAILPPDAHLIPVNTLSYHGLWLEGHLAPDTFLAARYHLAGVAGALISTDSHDALYAAANAGYRLIANYQWWVTQL